MNPYSVVLCGGGGGVHGKVCRLIGYLTYTKSRLTNIIHHSAPLARTDTRTPPHPLQLKTQTHSVVTSGFVNRLWGVAQLLRQWSGRKIHYRNIVPPPCYSRR